MAEIFEMRAIFSFKILIQQLFIKTERKKYQFGPARYKKNLRKTQDPYPEKTEIFFFEIFYFVLKRFQSLYC